MPKGIGLLISDYLMVRGVGADPTTPKERFYRPPSLPILCTLPYNYLFFVGGGGEIRTHSAISNGFTDRPDSPASAPSDNINRLAWSSHLPVHLTLGTAPI